MSDAPRHEMFSEVKLLELGRGKCRERRRARSDQNASRRGREGGRELREYARAPLSGRVAPLDDQAELRERSNELLTWAIRERDLGLERKQWFKGERWRAGKMTEAIAEPPDVEQRVWHATASPLHSLGWRWHWAPDQTVLHCTGMRDGVLGHVGASRGKENM